MLTGIAQDYIERKIIEIWIKTRRLTVPFERPHTIRMVMYTLIFMLRDIVTVYIMH